MEELNMQKLKAEDLALEREKNKKHTNNLRKAIIAYTKSTKFLVFFILFLCSSLITLIATLVVLSGISGVDIYQDNISNAPLTLLYYVQIPSIIIPLLGIYLVIRASKKEDINKLHHAFFLLSIYNYILFGTIVVGGAMLLLLITLMMMVTQSLLALFYGLIFGVVILFNYKLITSINNVLRDLMDICDQGYVKHKVRPPNFLRLRNCSILLLLIIIIAQFITIWNQQSIEGPSYSALITLFGPSHIMTYFVLALNIGLLGYVIYLLTDVDEHMALYESIG